MKEKRMPPVHPGEILLENFLKPLNLSQNRLAIEIRAHSKITSHFGSQFILAGCVVKTRHMLNMPAFSRLAIQATQLPKL